MSIRHTVGGAQKVEHYEIASYGTIAALAKQLGYNDALPLLLETLEEEKKTDQLLTEIAERINAEGSGAEANDQDEEVATPKKGSKTKAA